MEKPRLFPPFIFLRSVYFSFGQIEDINDNFPVLNGNEDYFAGITVDFGPDWFALLEVSASNGNRTNLTLLRILDRRLRIEALKLRDELSGNCTFCFFTGFRPMTWTSPRKPVQSSSGSKETSWPARATWAWMRFKSSRSSSKLQVIYTNNWLDYFVNLLTFCSLSFDPRLQRWDCRPVYSDGRYERLLWVQHDGHWHRPWVVDFTILF